MFGCATDEQLFFELQEGFKMDKCKPFNEHKYRVFENYFGKFFNTEALCDCADFETAKRLVTVLKEYYKQRPFDFFIKEIEK